MIILMTESDRENVTKIREKLQEINIHLKELHMAIDDLSDDLRLAFINYLHREFRGMEKGIWAFKIY